MNKYAWNIRFFHIDIIKEESLDYIKKSTNYLIFNPLNVFHILCRLIEQGRAFELYITILCNINGRINVFEGYVWDVCLFHEQVIAEWGNLIVWSALEYGITALIRRSVLYLELVFECRYSVSALFISRQKLNNNFRGHMYEEIACFRCNAIRNGE